METRRYDPSYSDLDLKSPSSIAKPTPPPPPPTDNPNMFVRIARKFYHPIGFRKGYNFTFWFICCGAMLGFCAVRTTYLDIEGVFFESTLLSEKYWYSNFSIYRLGITIHLACVVPAGILVFFQFIPVIRYKALFLHRLNGYLIILLILTGNAGALMIARRAFGGGVEIQTAVYTLATLTTTSLSLGYYNIKKLQIEQHRKWMIRAWSYLGVIITMRFVMLIAATIINQMGSYWMGVSCKELEFGFINGNNTFAAELAFRDRYPACIDLRGTLLPDRYIAIQGLADGRVEEVSVGYKLGFGMAVWVCLVLHAVLAEVYLALTSRETERLRMVSYEKQKARGWTNPGSGGLTADRVDGVPWVPRQTE
ncbi:uncharacterized protein DFL_000592 [Arthrobotrys flagrans]|uniref:DUF2306 domain-containing protein n=1 Tax=Arthrobotrys flagrans TaxID=97331 RepID=A0A437AFG5_ARTFL|nr:hypothetical protein DFL_000592 [Arthrobotrys flagrans]